MNRPPRGLLHRWFRSGEVTGVERLSGGYLNDVFRVDTASGPRALRIGATTTSADMVMWELRALEHVVARGVPVPRGLPAQDGAALVEHEGRVAVLFTFLDGEEPDRLRREHRLAGARMLARLHRALKEFDAPPRPGWTLPDGAPVLLADLDWRENRLWSWNACRQALLSLDPGTLPAGVEPRDIVDQMEHHIEVIGDRAKRLRRGRLPVQVIHGDYWPGNVRVHDDEVAGVFDWDDTHHDWRALEVGRSAGEFCRDSPTHDFNLAEVDEFFDAYTEAGGEILPEEREAFGVLVAAARVTETLYDFVLDPPATRDEEGWEYLLATLRLLRRLEASPGSFTS